MIVDKSRLLERLRARISADLEALERRQRDVQRGATHEESRAEHAKDTRATEQSYLARGLAERVEDLTRTKDALATIVVRDFAPEEPIALTAIVVLTNECDGEDDAANTSGHETWWVVPGAGGLDLEYEGARVRTVTPASPLGRSLLGLSAGDEGAFRTPRGERRFEILEVI